MEKDNYIVDYYHTISPFIHEKRNVVTLKNLYEQSLIDEDDFCSISEMDIVADLLEIETEIIRVEIANVFSNCNEDRTILKSLQSLVEMKAKSCPTTFSDYLPQEMEPSRKKEELEKLINRRLKAYYED